MVFQTHYPVFAHNANDPDESDVMDGLSYTPKDMNNMTAHGNSISLDAQAGNNFYSNTPDSSFDIPFERTRGVDMNDAFELSKRTKKGLSKLASEVRSGYTNSSSDV